MAAGDHLLRPPPQYSSITFQLINSLLNVCDITLKSLKFMMMCLALKIKHRVGSIETDTRREMKSFSQMLLRMIYMKKIDFNGFVGKEHDYY